MWDFIQRGGPLMYLIILSSVMAFAVLLERLYNLKKAKINTDKFMDEIAGLLRRNRVMEALEMCDKTPSPLSRIIKAGIMRHDRGRAEIKEAIEDAAREEVPVLEKNMGVLSTIAVITPLLGLLGTVTGMIGVFQVIEEKSILVQPVNPADLAGGVWEALLTTVAGLSVAIPAYVAYNYLASRVDALVLDMERSAGTLVNILTQRETVTR